MRLIYRLLQLRLTVFYKVPSKSSYLLIKLKIISVKWKNTANEKCYKIIDFKYQHGKKRTKALGILQAVQSDLGYFSSEIQLNSLQYINITTVIQLRITTSSSTVFIIYTNSLNSILMYFQDCQVLLQQNSLK